MQHTPCVAAEDLLLFLLCEGEGVYKSDRVGRIAPGAIRCEQHPMGSVRTDEIRDLLRIRIRGDIRQIKVHVSSRQMLLYIGELTVAAAMGENDLLIITADHGCDPTYLGTDHTRERVPLLCWHKGMNKIVDLGVRKSYADIAATICEGYGLSDRFGAQSFFAELEMN